MKKEEYLDQIRQLLQSLPPEDLERSLAFYAESIDDRMEDGMSEEEAVAAMESPESAANAILLEQPLSTLVKARVRDRRKKSALEILLLVLGFPLWLPLLLTALALAFTFILLAWVLVLVPAAVCLALGISAIALLFGGALSLTKIALPAILAAPGAVLILAGLAILAGFVVIGTVRLAVLLSKAVVRGIKSLLIRKEDKP
jgi:uncharacterized membrane protein